MSINEQSSAPLNASGQIGGHLRDYWPFYVVPAVIALGGIFAHSQGNGDDIGLKNNTSTAITSPAEEPPLPAAPRP